jgi:hypothetical protein
LAGPFHEVWVGRQDGQARTRLQGLHQGHPFENPLLSGFRRDREDEGPFGLRWGYGHRAVPELRLTHPFHSNGKGRYMEMDDMAKHGSLGLRL